MMDTQGPDNDEMIQLGLIFYSFAHYTTDHPGIQPGAIKVFVDDMIYSVIVSTSPDVW